MSGSVLWVLIFNVFLQVGSTPNNSCVVTVGVKHTAYNITKMPNVSDLEDCEYTWANASKHVLAHNLDKVPELVMSKSVDTLVILECINHTILSLNCYSQGDFNFHCFYVFLQVGSTQNNSCVVTVGVKHTAYNITKMPKVSHLEHCEYTWANASKHVLANNLDKVPELVMSKSVDTLVILECMNYTILSLDCYSQGLFTFHCFYVFLQVGSTQNNSCVVTVGVKHTAYNITKMPKVSHLEHCEYTWANASKHVLANNLDKVPELVMRKSVDTLVILECMNYTILSLDCYSQGLFTFHCFCACSERATLQKDKEKQMETSNRWIYGSVVIVVIVIILVLCFLVYRYKDDISRKCNHLSNYTPGNCGPTSTVEDV
ncbi:hypothetical protein D9C73_020482 [Collichthys lucidus]|uniref:Uncharacterized protein n=1 Tax=Collichthys lucidus TaxID=240159 RepID=A0A4U5VH78_COLLU|nr:hypothetical protein D9C73_020482 [Collichthys lucidus]